MKIVYNLYEIRTKRSMNLRELERVSGIGKTTINRIENGIANPTVEVICRLSIALKCSPYELFSLEI